MILRGTTARRGLALGAATACLLAAVVARPDAQPSDRFDVVVLDAGHGGHDEGARGPRGGLEKDVVLAVTERLARALRAR